MCSSDLRSFSYDANGNMTEEDGLSFTWDFKNRLVSIENDAFRAEYRYDYADRRIVKTVSTKAPSGGLQPGTVIYPGQHFEIRENHQPVKYVFNGAVRVARITGSLSTNVRIQRLQLFPGWNLCSVAVDGGTLPINPGNAFQWSPQGGNWLPVASNDVVRAGAVLWLYAATNCTLALKGSYSDPTNRVIPIEIGRAHV